MVSDIAARHLVIQRHKAGRQEKTEDDDYKCILKNDMLIDSLRQFEEGFQHITLPKKEHVKSRPVLHSPEEPESPLVDRKVQTGQNFRMSNPGKFTERHSALRERRKEAKSSKKEEEGPSSDTQKMMISHLMRLDSPKEPIEIPLQELKAQIERKNKARARLNERRAAFKRMRNNSRDESKTDTQTIEFQSVGSELNQTTESPARFHPKPSVDVSEAESPLVKSKKNKGQKFNLNDHFYIREARPIQKEIRKNRGENGGDQE